MIIKTNSLPTHVRAIVKEKGTEMPFSGSYNDFDEPGTYLCRQCGLALFHSQHKFHSGCGWPSFDEEISNAVKVVPDADGLREEIVCDRCNAHLGHVFSGEGFTAKNLRHCVNSLSIDFVKDRHIKDTEEAIFAAGCFWGVEHFLKQLTGVLKTEVGYTGGSIDNPSYEVVCSGRSGHYEAIRVVFDPNQISYETLTKAFFEIHDPTQSSGQGPDIGPQYLSAIFYYDETQKQSAESLINILNKKGYDIVTKLLPVSPFWPAEQYHQSYYEKNGKTPYCHRYVKRF